MRKKSFEQFESNCHIQCNFERKVELDSLIDHVFFFLGGGDQIDVFQIFQLWIR